MCSPAARLKPRSSPEAKKFDAVENREGKNAPAFQFMRLGYFCLDNQDCHADHLVFNRSVGLKDSFKK